MKKALGFFFTDIITARVQPDSLKQQNKSKLILLEITQIFFFFGILVDLVAKTNILTETMYH